MTTNPAEFIVQVFGGAFSWNFEFMTLVLGIMCLALLSSLGMSRGLLFVFLIGFTALFAAVVPSFGWTVWLLAILATVMILIGVKIWFSKIF